MRNRRELRVLVHMELKALLEDIEETHGCRCIKKSTNEKMVHTRERETVGRTQGLSAACEWVGV